MERRNKHPYYDSDRKRNSEAMAMKIVALCIATVLILSIVYSIVKVIG